MQSTDLKVLLVRHGETQWSLDGRHTSISDIGLTQNGIDQAKMLNGVLANKKFDLVASSPLRRAQDTYLNSGLKDECETWDELIEWRYGDYEGVTTQEIHSHNPEWNIFDHGAPGGESPVEITERADSIIEKIYDSNCSSICLFSHGHILRVLAGRWIQEPVQIGKHLVLSTCSISELGFERTLPAITLWNSTNHLRN